MRRHHMVLSVVMASCFACRGASQQFPEWRVGHRWLSALWLEAEIAAVGDVANPRLVATERLPAYKAPMVGQLSALHWCRGTFRALQVLKGRLDSGSGELLWASAGSQCEIPAAIRNTRANVWLLRRDGDFLRPIYDIGSHWTVRMRREWTPQARPTQEFGRRLLTVGEVFSTPEEVAQDIAAIGDIASSLIGTSETARMIRLLLPSLTGNDLDATRAYLAGVKGP